MSIGNGHHFCHVDEITLKTIVRANPGYVLLKNGTIKGKWSWANVPGQKSLQELIDKL
jgi:triosephosphate isomerase